VTLLLAAGLFLLRTGYGALRCGWSLAVLFRTGRRLRGLSSEVQHAGEALRVLPLSAPQAFMLGLARPSLYVTRGLLEPACREHLEAVLEHERSHARRLDGLRLLIANWALSFHLPGVAAKLRAQLGSAQEMAADAEAAERLGSGERIARALLCLMRAQRHAPVPRLALAFGGSDVEQRVRFLLDARARREWPSSLALWLVLAMASTGVALHAGAVHHAVEHALGFFG
jgi:Zn-dependent protease with chaperone function